MKSVFERIYEIHSKGFRQEHPCACGPASINLVAKAFHLNAPSESAYWNEKFGRWANVSEFCSRGMTINELQLTAELVFGEKIEFVYARAFKENFQKFVSDLERMATSNSEAVVLNFAQDRLLLPTDKHPQEAPHYSPVADLNLEDEKILIADVDKEVEDAYWASILDVFDAMAVPNPAFGIPRGWMTLRYRVRG